VCVSVCVSVCQKQMQEVIDAMFERKVCSLVSRIKLLRKQKIPKLSYINGRFTPWKLNR